MKKGSITRGRLAVGALVVLCAVGALLWHGRAREKESSRRTPTLGAPSPFVETEHVEGLSFRFLRERYPQNPAGIAYEVASSGGESWEYLSDGEWLVLEQNPDPAVTFTTTGFQGYEQGCAAPGDPFLGGGAFVPKYGNDLRPGTYRLVLRVARSLERFALASVPVEARFEIAADGGP